jgi:hypothetical protein
MTQSVFLDTFANEQGGKEEEMKFVKKPVRKPPKVICGVNN